MTPRFGARLIQEHHRLHFLSDRASLVGEWAEAAIDQLEAAFPTIIKELETKVLTEELDAQRQQLVTVEHAGFTCEADTSAVTAMSTWRFTPQRTKLDDYTNPEFISETKLIY